ncbi:hypothetical protein BHE90_017150 [Fusarium euwallaceae]|uniref:BZIP domain-containing protein n=1 Tax=Fusarium euwallaceae TaxID=1147111 RepID=A0A430KYB8_9HYPO|nr:hypothetical protein BHE90_017150 [Fusarium euwallaceae]
MPQSPDYTASSKTNWKRRFTTEQLERKRLSDRLNQRRSRRESKDYIAELEKKLQSLTYGNYETLVNDLMRENDILKASLRQCRARMHKILRHATNECLNESNTGHAGGETSGQHMRSLPGSPVSLMTHGEKASVEGLFPEAPCSFDFNSNVHGSSPKPDTPTVSIIFEAARLMLPPSLRPQLSPLTREEWMQSLLSWEMFRPNNPDYSFLISHFDLEKEPACLSTETIENIIQMPNYDGHILDCLLQENDIHYTLSTPLVDPTITIDAAERQRRAIILCVFKLIYPWQRYYKSLVEVGLVFWSMYKYFMFLIFPTESNLDELPAWLIPTPSQVVCKHPGFVDFLVWPTLRERLSLTWTHYNENQLIPPLIENFEVDLEAHHALYLTDVFPLSLDPKNQTIQLNRPFGTILQNLEWFKTRPEFGQLFPELMPCVNPSSSTSHVSSELNHLNLDLANTGTLSTHGSVLSANQPCGLATHPDTGTGPWNPQLQKTPSSKNVNGADSSLDVHAFIPRHGSENLNADSDLLNYCETINQLEDSFYFDFDVTSLVL